MNMENILSTEEKKNGNNILEELKESFNLK